MTTPERSVVIEHANEACRLYYDEATPLIQAGKFAEAIPLLARSLDLLVRCSKGAGAAHPRTHVVKRALVETLEQSGRSSQAAMAEAERIVESAERSSDR